MNRLMKWAYLAALLGGGAMLQWGSCGLFSGQWKWVWAWLQEDAFG